MGHVGDRGDIPAGEVAVEGGGAAEHVGHVGDRGDIPAGEGAVEGGGEGEHADMSVTEETSQLERSPLKEEAPLNMRDRSSTPERSGASPALYTMLEA